MRRRGPFPPPKVEKAGHPASCAAGTSVVHLVGAP
jgi:hypothetical protein